jgi:hypothetical protein
VVACAQIRYSVDLQVGIGLTNSAPKYSVILAGAYRFGASGLELDGLAEASWQGDRLGVVTE